MILLRVFQLLLLLPRYFSSNRSEPTHTSLMQCSLAELQYRRDATHTAGRCVSCWPFQNLVSSDPMIRHGTWYCCTLVRSIYFSRPLPSPSMGGQRCSRFPYGPGLRKPHLRVPFRAVVLLLKTEFRPNPRSVKKLKVMTATHGLVFLQYPPVFQSFAQGLGEASVGKNPWTRMGLCHT